jgi:DNA-binding transcriptional MerR regulator
MRYFRTGAFARKAGVTVRTIRYYDRLGLLRPSAYSESGQRLYSEMDYARLQQILTLKLIGLSLDEIGHLLTTDAAQMADLLERQRCALEEQARQLSRVAAAIEQAQRAMRESSALDWETFIQIIRAVNMNTQSDWLIRFVSAEERDKLAAGQNQTLDDQKRAGQAWQALFRDVLASMDKDARSAEVQQLVERWDALVAEVTQADADLAAGLNEAYAHLGQMPDIEHAPPEVEQWAHDLEAAAQFIQRAREENSKK